MSFLSGLFGGDKTTQTTTQTTSNTTYNDDRMAVSEGTLLAGGSSLDASNRSVDNSVVNITDGGAVAAAVNVIGGLGNLAGTMLADSLASSDAQVRSVLGFAGDSFDTSAGIVNHALDSTNAAYAAALAAMDKENAATRQFATNAVATVAESAKESDAQNTQLIVKTIGFVAALGLLAFFVAPSLRK